MIGYRGTLPLIGGIVTGFFAVMLACAGLSSVLSSFLPVASPYLRVVGVLYILWLALIVVRRALHAEVDQDSQAHLGFRDGLALQLVNPKVILYGLTVFTTFLAPVLNRSATLIWAPIALAGMALVATSVWAIGGHFIKRWISSSRRARLVAYIMAAALIYTAIDMSGMF